MFVCICMYVHKCVDAHVCGEVRGHKVLFLRGKPPFFLLLCLTHRYADMGREMNWVLNSMVSTHLGLDLLNDLDSFIHEIIMPT